MSDHPLMPAEHRCCWHEYQGSPEVAGMGLYHCCRPGCLDLLVARAGAAVEEKTHGYVKGWRPQSGGMEPPRVRAVGPFMEPGGWVQTADGMQMDLTQEGRQHVGDRMVGALAEALAAQVARTPEGHAVRIVAKVYSRDPEASP